MRGWEFYIENTFEDIKKQTRKYYLPRKVEVQSIKYANDLGL